MDLTQLHNADLIMVDFYADWCGPCRMMAPLIAQLEGQVPIIKINIETHPHIAEAYNIRSIPTILLLKKGEVQKTLVGFQPLNALTQAIDEVAHGL